MTLDRKIVCVMPSLFRGGAERQLCLLMEQLVNYGYNVTFVSYSKRPDMYPLPCGVKRVKKTGNNHLFSFLKLFLFFTFSIKKGDIIISFCRENNVVVLLATLLCNGYIIAGERNLLQDDNIKSRFAFWLYKRKVDYIVSNSYSQEIYLKETLPSMNTRISCIINYTDINTFFPKPILLNKNAKRIIGVFARYNPQKNFENFVEAIKMTVDEGYDNFKFVWHGSKVNTDGSVNQYFSRFSDLIALNNLSSYIELESTTEKIVEYINYCDAICLPSIYEGFSNSIAEAISCGKLVLASNTSDNPIMVKDGINGYTFNPYKPQEMANAFVKYLNMTEEEVVSFERNSRELAEQLFDLKKFTNDYITLIEKCK